MIFDFIKNTVLNFFFPKRCLSCGEEGNFVCENCLKKISFLQNQQCPQCRRKNLIGNFCNKKCQNLYNFNQLIVSCYYKNNSLIKKIITAFKYRFLRELRTLLAIVLKTQFIYLSQFINFEENVVFVPVPIHKKRLGYRGFNQSAELAKTLLTLLKTDEDFSKKFANIKFSDCLIRTRYLHKQASLHRSERLQNLTDSINFSPSCSDQIKGKFCILIDDVATTCTTLNECSKVLKQNGATYVCGLVLARGI